MLFVLDWRDWSHPDVDVFVVSIVIADDSALDAKRILIDGDDVLVEYQRFDLRCDRSEIVRQQERSSNTRPNSHLSLALVVTQSISAEKQSVWIVPMSWPSSRDQSVLVVGEILGNRDHRLVAVINVFPVAP